LQIGEEKEERDFQPDKAAESSILPFVTIKRKIDFEKLREKGRLLKNKYLILYILPQKKEMKIRAGFGIGKKIGKAFQRNKIRRILKEILRKVSVPYAIDIFVIARHSILKASFTDIKKELEKSLEKFFLST
jgi:ribonuclease P protein component